MHDYFPEYYEMFTSIMTNHYQYEYDKKMQDTNCNYNIPNTFEWIYDLGNDWRCNIYVEDIHYNDDDTKQKWCEYISGSGIPPPDNLGDFEDFYLMCLKCLDKYKYEINEFKTKQDFYEWLESGDQNIRWKQLYLDKNEWNAKIYPEWVTKIKPYYKPYNLNIDECFKWAVFERSIGCSVENRYQELRILRKNIRKDRKCNLCKTRKKTLMKCKGCRKISYCSKKCQKVSWKYNHRYSCNK